MATLPNANQFHINYIISVHACISVSHHPAINQVPIATTTFDN